MKSEPLERLLGDVVLDEELRTRVRTLCAQELRARASAETALLHDMISAEEGGLGREAIRGECLTELRRRPAARRVRIIQVAAAAVFLVLVGASLLSRSAFGPRVATLPALPPVPLLPPAQNDYVVRSRPVAEHVFVRTAEHAPSIARIGDDELMDSLPGLSIARTWDVEGNAVVYLGEPGQGRIHRLN